MKKIITTLILIFGLSNVFAQKPIYAFAYAQDFNDSTVYITTIQTLPQAKLTRGFLENRAQWSNQLDYFLEYTNQADNATVAIFYNKNKSKLKKKLNKVTSNINKDFKKKIIFLKEEEFIFTPLQ